MGVVSEFGAGSMIEKTEYGLQPDRRQGVYEG